MSNVLWRSSGGGLRCLLCLDAPTYHINSEEGRKIHGDTRNDWLVGTMCCPPRMAAVHAVSRRDRCREQHIRDHLFNKGHGKKLLAELQADAMWSLPTTRTCAATAAQHSIRFTRTTLLRNSRTLPARSISRPTTRHMRCMAAPPHLLANLLIRAILLPPASCFFRAFDIRCFAASERGTHARKGQPGCWRATPQSRDQAPWSPQ